ncbi:MAG: tetratricopeptide repeat protein, partial [Verrucomicrobia bacterium]|nr:tetratricopeptide repeat protein [Verrucomicrobiota bacterium]
GYSEAATVQELAAKVRSELAARKVAEAAQTLKTLEAQFPDSTIEFQVLQGELFLTRFERDCHPWNISAGGPVQSVIGKLDQPFALKASELSACQYRMRALGLEHADLAAAHQAFLRAESLQRGFPSAMRGLAKTHYYRGDKVAALTYLDDAIAHYPTDGDLYHYRGITQISLGRLQKGSDDLRKAVALQPEHIEARLRLLEQLYPSGEDELVSHHEGWFLRHRANDLATARSCGLAWLSISVLSKNDQAKSTAIALIKALPKHFPNNWESWYLVGSLLTAKRQDYTQAEAAFTQALRLLNDENNPYRLYRYRATVRQLAGDWPGALEDASLCMQHEPLSAVGCDDYNRVLRSLDRSQETGPQEQRFQNLVKLYEVHRKLDLDPSEGRLWVTHARHVAGMGWPDWAFDSFRRAEVLLPDSTEPVIGKAEMLLAQREHKAAIAECDRAIKLGAGRDAWSIRGDAWLALGDPAKAVADFERAMRLDEAVVDACLLLAKQRLKAGDKKGADEAIRKAIFIAPDRREQLTRLLQSTSAN